MYTVIFEGSHVYDSFQIMSSEAKVMDTVIFEGPPPTVQKLWPSHCVQGSWGSELHTELKVTFSCSLFSIQI